MLRDTSVENVTLHLSDGGTSLRGDLFRFLGFFWTRLRSLEYGILAQYLSLSSQQGAALTLRAARATKISDRWIDGSMDGCMDGWIDG